ncbi:MAG: hypothetical protein HXO60_07065 [Rothia mucilaginosa]|uniref:hypothetical protein n=1 Tax=Rothia mucilaginosa TaxID=43675 RepID=UPI001CAAD534|nr:hypothetical protein [Rothia mucilaginosa]MBF1652244.1 hypothetical protein [Rothia mucilaginosa]
MSKSTEIEETPEKASLLNRISDFAEKSVPVAKAAALGSVALFLGGLTILSFKSGSSTDSDSEE